MAHFTVIGLGRFGVSASLELIHLGHTVTGVDLDPKIVEKYAEDLTESVICDSSDESVLRELNLCTSEAVLVAIGEDMQSSLLCTLALKNIGVKNIWVKASTKAHHTIVSKLGVQRIIHPEDEMGIRVAQSLNYPMVNNYLAIGHGIYVVEIHIKQILNGQTLSQVLGDVKNTIKPIMVKREETIFSQLEPLFVLQANDILLLCGTRAQLKYVAPRLV
ncbi:TrkA family potassium uptake protein [Shewanella sp. SR43-4]|jgi:trk system potassium uptake protein TrkA|uniref:TrkA family potassium uptake protein n=1 Tax=Shewanella vesiculosa TaxID=518738 RepID=A0ABV0FTW7_9GAMM|nr:MULTISPECIES: TrkA family potassium uptake protein [Shewanella]NCQ44968.1 TrkA family potassium uptake protein [Shewanella frigidimarina]MBB1318907.1 TrkA family potassium uptake protein [Shewanella sp. SR43-4]MBB1323089.1 TrkA family potassium uptake protein [Shewanella sp. SR43-8]MBB1391496.1 TrkA family potassium uptake protein [Shewanella sp. SG44-6]MBB1477170.1 TrkA family potassium uptake protein [Shewanella sp. SG41-3]|tara:strand:- start:492 stop:1145 length:654 start_codon:yes stop_codon:yes gene_type:complete